MSGFTDKKNKSMTKQEKTRDEAIKTLKQVYKLKPNSTIIVNQTSVSSSGMTRRLELYIVNKKSNRLDRITYLVGDVLDWNVNDTGLKVQGCGMDMHFHTVSTLSHYMFGIEDKAYTGNGGSCMNWQSI